MGLQTQERPVDTSATQPVVVDGQPEAPDAFEAAFEEFVEKQSTEQPEADATGTSGDAAATTDTQPKPAAAATPTQQTGTQPSDTTARPEVPAKPAPFDWSKAPQEMREAHEADITAARARESQLEQQNRRIRGQVSSLARTPRPTPTPAAVRPAAGDRAPPKPPTDADIIKIGEDIPEVAPMAESFVALRRETEQLRSERNADHAQRTEAFYQDQYDQLIAKHPDYDTLVNKDGKTNPAFIAWAEAQPPWLQELVNKNGKELEDLSAADEVISRFRAHVATSSGSQPQGERNPAPSNPMAARRAEQLKGSETVRSRGGAAGTGPPDDFDAAFEHFATQKRTR